ncbi:hypothetical protein PoB_003581700 [Plakobranchus ocellatus]|uniref:Uncharacterized protein n=1 Tax=Plakobranchus ocellatus TaxID=259542 RepID=A0AAV4AQU7_9GAST|nr:hypothetical protein PoB_003581700 [Plakobranchus ocellatus]
MEDILTDKSYQDGAPPTPETPTNTYPTSGPLMTFMSPRRSPASSSSSSVMPRSSLSNSMNSDTAKKRLWADSNSGGSNLTPSTSNVASPSSDTTPTNMSKTSASSLPYTTGFSETVSSGSAAAGGVYRPNINFSDDSVTANATVGGTKNSNHMNNNINSNRTGGINNTPFGRTYGPHSGSSSNLQTVPSPRSPETLSPVPLPTASKPMVTPTTFTSTRRPQITESDNMDTPYRQMAVNLSRIPTDPEVSTRHGTFLEGPSTSLVDATGSSRPSRSYANASRSNSNDKTNPSNVFTPTSGFQGGLSKKHDLSTNYSNNGNSNYLNSNRNSFHGDVRNNNTSSFNPANNINSNNLSQTRLGGSLRADAGFFGQRPYAVSGHHRPNLSTIEQSSACSSNGEPYSMSDMKAVLDAASTVDTPRDDDNTTTTSGSYTINADDLCQEIDHLFFKDIVV